MGSLYRAPSAAGGGEAVARLTVPARLPGGHGAWGRSENNPVGGWYGLNKGYRGRSGNYVPPVLEALGLAEGEHNARNNRMRVL